MVILLLGEVIVAIVLYLGHVMILESSMNDNV